MQPGIAVHDTDLKQGNAMNNNFSHGDNPGLKNRKETW